jgi:hypothetical protein
MKSTSSKLKACSTILKGVFKNLQKHDLEFQQIVFLQKTIIETEKIVLNIEKTSLKNK